MLFIPNHNANGETRFVVSILDDYQAETVPVAVDILVLPINDPPAFVYITQQYVYMTDVNASAFIISGKVNDTDFVFGKSMRLTLSVPNGTGEFVLPQLNAPCEVSDNGTTLSCEALINQVNSWFGNGLEFIPDDVTEHINLTLAIDDLGNIDKDLNPNITYAWLDLNRTLTADNIATVAPASTDSTLLIAAPIAGLLAGALIVAAVWWFRGKQAAGKVDAYFDRMALEMEGTTQSSPLYQGATRGGESVLYKDKSSAGLKPDVHS